MLTALFKSKAMPIVSYNGPRVDGVGAEINTTTGTVDAGYAYMNSTPTLASVTPLKDSIHHQLVCPYCSTTLERDTQLVCDSCAILYSQSPNEKTISSSTSMQQFQQSSPKTPVKNQSIVSKKNSLSSPAISVTPTNRDALLTIRLEHDSNHIDEYSIIVRVDENFRKKLEMLIATSNQFSPSQTSKQNENENENQPASGTTTKQATPMTTREDVSYVENRANAGAFGGERIIPNVDNSFIARSKNKKIPGPRQIPEVEKITIQDRVQQQQRLNDSGGSRVNQPSRIRAYSLSGYERYVFIDPDRHSYSQSKSVIKPTTNNASNPIAVPIEIAAVGAKIRNIHRTGGERIKEMDHYVASVETSVRRLKLSNGELIENRSVIGAISQQTVKKSILSDALSIHFPPNLLPTSSSSSTPITILLAKDFLSDTSSNVDESIIRYCSIFYTLLYNVFDILGIEYNQNTVQIYYMSTVRANEFVCSVSSPLNSEPVPKLYANALAFQQSECCVLENNDMKFPISIRQEKMKDILAYWVTRVSLAYHEAKITSISEEAKLGLYSKAVRSRFQMKLIKLGVSDETIFNNQNVSLLSNESKKSIQQSIIPPVVKESIPSPLNKAGSSNSSDDTVKMLQDIVGTTWTVAQLEHVLLTSNGDINSAIDTILNIGDPNLYKL